MLFAEVAQSLSGKAVKPERNPATDKWTRLVKNHLTGRLAGFGPSSRQRRRGDANRFLCHGADGQPMAPAPTGGSCPQEKRAPRGGADADHANDERHSRCAHVLTHIKDELRQQLTLPIEPAGFAVGRIDMAVHHGDETLQPDAAGQCVVSWNPRLRAPARSRLSATWRRGHKGSRAGCRWR